jgi:PII-like signaling protein
VGLTSSATGPPDDTGARGPASGLELAVYFHTMKQAGRRLLADELLDECAERRLPACVLVTGADGFGDARRMRAEISEGAVPLMATATYGRADCIDPSTSISRLARGSLTTLADVDLVDAADDVLRSPADEPSELVIYCRIGEARDDPTGIGGVIKLLREHGVLRALALSGGDGVTAGDRQRDSTFLRSPTAPAMVVAIATSRVLAAAVPALLARPHVELVSAKPLWVWKCRGRVTPTPIAEDAPGWRKLTIYAAEDALSLRPRQTMLVSRLREAGAAGVTVVRGRLGHSLGEPLRPQRGLFTRRQTPLMTTIIDTRDQIAGWFEIVDELTGDDDLVTCEAVRVVSAPP